MPTTIITNPLMEREDEGILSINLITAFILVGIMANINPSNTRTDASPKKTFSITRSRFPSCNRRIQNRDSLQ